MCHAFSMFEKVLRKSFLSLNSMEKWNSVSQWAAFTFTFTLHEGTAFRLFAFRFLSEEATHSLYRTSSIAAGLVTIQKTIHCISTKQPTPWIILSNFHAELKASLCATSGAVYFQFVYSIVILLQKVLSTGHKVNFQWLPGHCEIPCNETTDKLANRTHHHSPSSNTTCLTPALVAAYEAVYQLSSSQW